MEGEGSYPGSREPGTRRRKLAGYLKAANELRQTYQQAYVGGRDENSNDEDAAVPGAFPDGTVVRHGDEEMLLFPSYARRHQPKKVERHERPGTGDDLRNEQGPGDAEYWKKEWEKYEDDNAIVDVDIRGWIYAPHRGQMSRKNRILVGMARRLSGIPAPASSRASSPSSPHHARMEARAARHEDEIAEKEAQKLEMRGQGEADVALQGGYSESPTRQYNQYSIQDSPEQSRDPSPNPKEAPIKPVARQLSNISLRSVDKRATWNQPSDMSSEELSIANAHLMMRLKPFLTTPLVSTALTVFFYNDKESKSRTITTNESGHFTYRAALDFIPTHVRVLASDKLSATEEVFITESKGVSMISDIDDTIKHSAIGAGAREIFRNAFIRELDDLSIEGVKEWYQTLADMGVKLHYVSNSPWQFYPVLTSFFAAAGLPKGSFHLKQYTGMLQGIFEPVAERKKGTLDKLIADFPERRFILVGDSGEADLELYTDIMLANPGRILAVFIRDVTTSQSKGFFDSTPRTSGSQSPIPGHAGKVTNASSGSRPTPAVEKRPALPPRPLTRSSSTVTVPTKSRELPTEKLIDFDDEAPAQIINYTKSDPIVSESTVKSTSSPKSPPPSRPSKPLALRPTLNGSQGSSQSLNRKPAPPPPPKPRQYSSYTEQSTAPADPSPLAQSQTSSTATPEPQTYSGAVRNKVSAAYNSLPAFYASNLQLSSLAQPPHLSLANKPNRGAPPPVPPSRRALTTSLPTSAQSSSSSGGAPTGYNDPANNPDNLDGLLTKKEELWLRRWERAREIFRDKGVLLRTWRVGEDVADECVRVVKKALREVERNEKAK